jgi:cysteine-rich repeat protein
MILSSILIFSINTVFAQISQSYEECINAFKNDDSNYAKCNALKQEAEKCSQEIENAEQTCNAKFEQDKSICEATLNFECVDEIEEKISDCIKTLKSDQKRAECALLQAEADTCFTEANKSFEEICKAQFPKKIDPEVQKCINEKLSTSQEAKQLPTLLEKQNTCLDLVQSEYNSFLNSCKQKCTGESVDNSCVKECNVDAEEERDRKIEKCEEAYDELYNELSERFKKECEEEIEEAKRQQEAEEKAAEKERKCGNGELDKGEECDDGNNKNFDGCNSECKIEPTVPPSIPKISTVPGPEAENVSTVSPYLMTNFLPRVARTIISFAIGAAVLGLIISSIVMLTAYGNEEKYSNAKKGLYFSMIGLAISLLAFAIVQLVFFTGFQIGNIR